MQVHRNLDKAAQSRFNKLLEAVHGGDLNKLLAKVVTKLVGHDVWEYVEHHMDEACGKATLISLLTVSLLKQLLNASASSLIEGQYIDLLADVKLLFGEVCDQVLGHFIDLLGCRLLDLASSWVSRDGRRGEGQEFGRHLREALT